jgi:choline dehydrogenase-like flavoprotein
MLYVCGTDRDYDSWAAAGNTGWDYGSMLPLIKRSERNLDLDIAGDGTYHGTDGLLKVSSPDRVSISDELEAGFNQIGYRSLADYNSQTYNGFVRLQATISRGERIGAYRAFLAPAKHRKNLFFMKNSEATSIIFNETRATGVLVRTSESMCPTIQLHALKEVIISAGGLGSPKILLQSGIGRPADLPPQIVPRKDLPVGRNLQDHVLSVHFFRINPNVPTLTLLDMAHKTMEYFYNRTGTFAQLGVWNAQGFINTADPNDPYPDIQLDLFSFPKDQQYMEEVLSNFGFKDEYIAKIVEENARSEVLMVFNILLNPKSTGTYELRSSDPSSPPIITSNFYEHDDDVDTTLRGIGKIFQLMDTEAMQSVSPSPIELPIGECGTLDEGDDYWRCYIRHFSQSLWHPAGTCKMGPTSDSEAVVDPSLRVHGFTNLRVADASIMPTIVSGNTQCPTYAIGQKAVDLVLADWPQENSNHF